MDRYGGYGRGGGVDVHPQLVCDQFAAVLPTNDLLQHQPLKCNSARPGSIAAESLSVSSDQCLLLLQ
jgi:hypothetical protein